MVRVRTHEESKTYSTNNDRRIVLQEGVNGIGLSRQDKHTWAPAIPLAAMDQIKAPSAMDREGNQAFANKVPGIENVIYVTTLISTDDRW